MFFTLKKDVVFVTKKTSHIELASLLSKLVGRLLLLNFSTVIFKKVQNYDRFYARQRHRFVILYARLLLLNCSFEIFSLKLAIFSHFYSHFTAVSFSVFYTITSSTVQIQIKTQPLINGSNYGAAND